jgi:hypothetical protein
MNIHSVVRGLTFAIVFGAAGCGGGSSGVAVAPIGLPVGAPTLPANGCRCASRHPV